MDDRTIAFAMPLCIHMYRRFFLLVHREHNTSYCSPIVAKVAVHLTVRSFLVDTHHLPHNLFHECCSPHVLICISLKAELHCVQI